MNVVTTWTALKALVVDKGLVRFDERETYYSVVYNDIETVVRKDSGADQTDFETNYKSLANKAPTPRIDVEKISPYGAKSFMLGSVLKKLYARNPGIQAAVAAGGPTNIDYTITYPWAKVIGIEIINGEALDYVDLKVMDTATGTYSGVPNYVLNQFAATYNIAAQYHKRDARFDADLYQGMIIRIVYTSISAKTVGVNFILDEVKD